MVDGKNQAIIKFEGLQHLKRAVISLEASRNPALCEITARNSYGNNKNEISSSTPNPRVRKSFEMPLDTREGAGWGVTSTLTQTPNLTLHPIPNPKVARKNKA